MVVNSLYYQNASKVGGTALAGYPMLHIDAGVAPRTDLNIYAPSQLAQSGLRGAGLYPHTDAGIGVSYDFVDLSRTSLGIGVAERPPLSLYSTKSAQPSFALDSTAFYRLSQIISLSGYAAGAMTNVRGVSRLLPTVDVGIGYAIAQDTQISTGIGSRALAFHNRSQTFGDLSVSRVLRKNLALDTGLGTTFNPVSNAKAHYLSAGLDFKH